MIMSISSEIQRIQLAKADIKAAIEGKGVTVSSNATLDDYADLIDSISTGGGVTPILIDGYEPCDYVVPSSVSAIITTGVTAFGSVWELDLQDSVITSAGQIFICSSDFGGCYANVNSSGNWSLGSSYVMTSASTRTTIGIEFITKGLIMTIGANSTQRVGTYDHNPYVTLFGYNNKYLYQGKIYGIKCVSGGSFEGVPAKRISDSAYGLYDIANKVFYTNFTGA